MLRVCVPEGGAVGQCVEERRVKVAELQTVFRRTGFPFHVLPLEQVSVGAEASRVHSLNQHLKPPPCLLARRSNCLLQVLDLSSTAMATVPSPPERPAGAYKAAVGDFIQNDSSSCSALDAAEAEETPVPAAEDWKTQALQQLMASAKTLTAREDLLCTLRLDHTRTQHGFTLTLCLLLRILQKPQQRLTSSDAEGLSDP